MTDRTGETETKYSSLCMGPDNHIITIHKRSFINHLLPHLRTIGHDGVLTCSEFKPDLYSLPHISMCC